MQIKLSSFSAHVATAVLCIRLPSRPVVRNPPVMPSKYVRVPRKKPDKMGFDEVSKDGVSSIPSSVCAFALE